jgi:hypothetical protein
VKFGEKHEVALKGFAEPVAARRVLAYQADTRV